MCRATGAGLDLLVEPITDEQQLAALKKDHEFFEEMLGKVNEEIREIKMRLIFKEYGVKVGSIVKDRKGTEYLVTKIKPQIWSGKPWLNGNPRKKDGTFGKADRELFESWAVIQP